MNAPAVPVKTMALVLVILITTDANVLRDLRDRTVKVCLLLELECMMYLPYDNGFLFVAA